MRILITGGAGCLGSNLIEHWLPLGHEILVIDNFATGKREAIPPVVKLTLVEGSISDRDLVWRAFTEFRPTHVIHAAASYKNPANWCEDIATNVEGTIHVLKAAREVEVARFINFQTALCYGSPKCLPIPVDHPLRPRTSYAISKVAGEQYVAASGLPWVSLRLANVTGPRLAIGPLPIFYNRLKAGQECICTEAVRDFLDMSDFIAAVDRVMGSDVPGGVFNIASGQGHTIREVYDAVRMHLGLEYDRGVKIVPAADGDVPALVPDPELTTTILKWRATIGFAETMCRMLTWYDVHCVTEIHSHLGQQKP